MPQATPEWFALISAWTEFSAKNLRIYGDMRKHMAAMALNAGGIGVLDDRDRKLLALMQQDGSVAVGELAEKVNLSLSACSRRIQRLEEAGYIARRIVVLDRERMGVPTTVFALIKTAHHSDEWIETFRKAISDIPEIVEAHRLTGNYDYIVKVVLPRVEHYDVVYKQIVRKVELFDVSASISMEILKSGTAVPVDYAV
jgi:Lrp/AsnC family transcriptional regulator